MDEPQQDDNIEITPLGHDLSNTIPENPISKQQQPKRKILKWLIFGFIIFIAIIIGTLAILKPFSKRPKFVITVNKQQLNGTDTLEITATFTNNSIRPAHFSFSSGCNEPDFLVNGKDLNGPTVCTEALTEVTIAGNSQKTWKRTVPSAKITEGELNVQAEWYGYKSNIINVEKTLSETDKARQAECPKLKTPVRYCTQLVIMPSESISRAEMSKKLDILNIELLPTPKTLKPSNPNDNEYTYFVQVPPDQKDEWITKIQSSAGLVTEDDSILNLSEKEI